MILLINKPKGWTSFDVVAYIRSHIRKSGLSGNLDKTIKVGHAGTLDPFATGLLIVAIGREDTKRLDEFQHLPKTYITTLHLGATSDTLDSTGKIIESGILKLESENGSQDSKFKIQASKTPSKRQILDVLQNFLGKQLQTPPMFSAKKIGGVRLYELARQGKTIEREPCEIEIFKINLLDYNYPLLKIEVECSSGTYIRTLADDIGKKLGVGAYCEELARTRIGEYKLSDAKDLKDLAEL